MAGVAKLCTQNGKVLWMGECNVRVAWVLAVNYGRGGCARDRSTANRGGQE